MSYPCPNGCPRDAGEYCDRHSCIECSERLTEKDGAEVCKSCANDYREYAGMILESCEDYHEGCRCRGCDITRWRVANRMTDELG